MTVYALWHGGPNYAAGSVDDDLEIFRDTADAVDALVERATVGSWRQCTFYFANGTTDDVRVPVVTESQMQLFHADPRGSDDPYPDEVWALDSDDNPYREA